MLNRAIFVSFAMLAAGASTAAAGAGAVVVLGFEGPPALADDTRTLVVNLVARDHDVISPKRWVKARRAAEERDVGPRAWARASKDAGVDAVIEGAIHGDGGRYTLTLAAREAKSGNEIDTIEVAIGKRGLSRAARQQLRGELADLLDWVDGSGEAARGLDDEELEGGEDLADLEEEEEKDEEEPRPEPRPSEVRGDDLVALFKDETEAPPPADAAPGPRKPGAPGTTSVELTGGGYLLSRTFEFIGGENLPGGYPGRMARGARVAGAIHVGRLGVAGSVSRSMGSYVDVEHGGELLDLPVTQTRWSVAARYRHTTGGGTRLEASFGYGGLSHFVDDVPEDAGEDFDLMDGEYAELEAGGRVELAIGPSARLGFGLLYLYPTDAGAISAPELLGNGTAWGVEGSAELQIAVGRSVHVTAGVDYRRLSLTFDGDGDMMSTYDVDAALDTYTGAHLGAGTRF